MLSKELVGLCFKGYFKKNSSLIESSKSIEREKKETLSPEEYEIFLKNEDFLNMTHEFEINFLYLSPFSNYFIARGEDVLGESVLTGRIEESKINFSKQYFGYPLGPLQKNPHCNNTIVYYDGEIEVQKEHITIGGVYNFNKYPRNPESPKGLWKVVSSLSS